MGKNGFLDDRSKDEIEKKIAEIKKLDLKSTAIDFLKKKLDVLIKGYCCLTKNIDMNIAFRARKKDNSKLFTKVNELWYPPANLITKYGRLNNINQTIFYCSSDEATAILELRPKVGDYITVLTCRPKGNIHVMELGISERASQYNHPHKSNILENTVQGRNYLGKKENIEKNLLLRTFLYKEFTKIVESGEEYKYKISIAIADILMSSDKIDGVWYPSIASDFEKSGSNLALKAQSADKIFEPYECWQLLIEKELAPFKYQVLCTNKSKNISNNGIITW